MTNARHRHLILLGAILGTAIFVTGTLLAAGDPIDDAGITYRFAHNLAAGDGLRFNPGGERVEGYVHFLWIALLAGVDRVTGIEPIEAGPWLGRLFGALTVIWTALVAARLGRGAHSPWLAAAPLLVGSNLYLVLWASAGLETLLFTWLTLVTLHLVFVGGRAASIGAPLTLVLACMTRPEGVVFGLALVLDRRLDRPRLNRHTLTPLVVFLVPAAAYFLWRWHYFGHLLPNVFHAKAHPALVKLYMGCHYLRAFVLRDEPRILLPGVIGILVLIATLVPICAALGRRATQPRRLFVIIATLWTAVVVYEGGDWMGAFRFFVPVIPIAGLLAAETAGRLADEGGAGARRARLMAAILVAAPLAFNLVNGALYAAEPPASPERTWFHQRAYYDDTAGWVRDHVPEGSLVALGDVGYIPYATPKVRYIDFLGLVDPVIAHLEGGVSNPEIYAYIFRRRPDYFISIRHHLGDGSVRGHTPVDETMLQFDRPDLPRRKRLFAPVVVLPGWVEDGHEVRFHVYERVR